MCFITGTIIFEDTNNILYNFLTYGIISNNLECIDINKYPQISSSHGTFTHKEVFSKNNIISNEKCFNSTFANLCTDNKCFKLELILNKPLVYICDTKTKENERDENNKSEKSIVLYYRFYNTSTQQNFLFFKLEKHNMNSVSHLNDFFNKNRKDTYNNRRENEGLQQYNKIQEGGGLLDWFRGNSNPDSNPDSKPITKYANIKQDTEFYNNLIINDNIDNDEINKIIPHIDINEEYILRNINYYNQYIRTGSELYIVEELKNYLIKTFINDNKLFYLII